MKCIGVSKTLPVWLFFTKKDYFMLGNDSFKIEGIWLRGKGMINIMTIVDMVISPHNIFKYEPSCFYPFKRQSHKWPNKLKQFVGKLPTNCLSVFDHFVELALKGLILLQAFTISIMNNLTVDFKEILFLFQKYWFRNDPIYEWPTQVCTVSFLRRLSISI